MLARMADRVLTAVLVVLMVRSYARRSAKSLRRWALDQVALAEAERAQETAALVKARRVGPPRAVA